MKIKSKHPVKIGFDLDGVLIDHGKNIKKIAARLGYKNIPEKAGIYEIKKIVSANDYRKIQKYIYGKATLSAPAMNGAETVVEILGKEREVFIVSRRQPGNRRFGRRWISRNLKFLAKNIFFTDRDEDKGKAVKKLKISVFLDDKLSVLELLPTGVAKFLFGPFYSQKRKKINDIRVVHSFGEFYKIVKLR